MLGSTRAIEPNVPGTLKDKVNGDSIKVKWKFIQSLRSGCGILGWRDAGGGDGGDTGFTEGAWKETRRGLERSKQTTRSAFTNSE